MTDGEGHVLMIVTALGLASAIVWGTADFFGGAASRRASPFAVLMVSLPSGLAAVTAVAVIAGGSMALPGLAWGFGAGVAGGLGLIAFYTGLAEGPMSVVAPVSALVTAAVPVLTGLAWGDRLSIAVAIGMALCLLAIVLVSLEAPTAAGRRFNVRGMALAVASGLAFGLFFTLLRVAGSHTVLWPLVAAKAGGLVAVLLAAVLWRRQSIVLPAGLDTIALTAAVGALDVAGNGLYLLAARAGMLSVAAVLASLYPAMTLLLARLVYRERLRPIQRAGLVVALAGITLVTA